MQRMLAASWLQYKTPVGQLRGLPACQSVWQAVCGNLQRPPQQRASAGVTDSVLKRWLQIITTQLTF